MGNLFPPTLSTLARDVSAEGSIAFGNRTTSYQTCTLNTATAPVGRGPNGALDRLRSCAIDSRIAFDAGIDTGIEMPSMVNAALTETAVFVTRSTSGRETPHIKTAR